MNMVSSVINAFIDFFMSMLEVVSYAFLAVFIPMFVMLLFFFVVSLLKGKRLPKRTKPQKLHYQNMRFNPIKLFFWDFPKRFITDLFNKNPDGFDTFGIHIFAGEQGSGKSIAMVHFLKCILERNPFCKIASNIDLNFQDDVIEDWRDILDQNNGELGQCIVIDEIQNWFSSNESKNFPPDMLTEVTQQRKQRKCIVGTSQVFTRISKPIREQITLLYKPFTVLGCLTVVRVYKVNLTDDGNVDKMRALRWYAFVHDDELRNAYDTFQKVQRMSLKGFQPRSEQLARNEGNDQQVNVNVSVKK